jgi:hypothetical protein
LLTLALSDWRGSIPPPFSPSRKKQVKDAKGVSFSLSIDELAGLAGIESGQHRMILEKLASVRILAFAAGEHVTIADQEQVDRLLRDLEMREILGEMA